MSTPQYQPSVGLSRDELVERVADLVVSDEELLYALIEARKAAGLTQRQVAEILGVKQPTVAKFEHHDSDPKLSTIRRYALAVGAHVRHEVLPAEQMSDPLLAWTGRESGSARIELESTVREAGPLVEVNLVEPHWTRLSFGVAA